MDLLDGPVICPACRRPFEIKMPTAVVTSVHDVDGTKTNKERMAIGPEERTLAKVHPVVFRARPGATVILGLVFLAAVVAMVMLFAGHSVDQYFFDETMILGSASLLTWACGITMLVIVGVVGYWISISRFTTLTVTTERSIYQRGIVARETSEVRHDDVRNIQLEQTFSQRLLSIGDVSISSSGQDGLEVIAKRLPNPKGIIDVIRARQE